jgi:hypothetical protein
MQIDYSGIKPWLEPEIGPDTTPEVNLTSTMRRDDQPNQKHGLTLNGHNRRLCRQYYLVPIVQNQRRTIR